MSYRKKIGMLEHAMDWSKEVQKALSHAGRDFDHTFEEELEDKVFEITSIQNQLNIMYLQLDQLIMSIRSLLRQLDRD